MFNPLQYPICFQTPERLSGESAWTRHIPFALTLMQTLRPKVLVELGTHGGDSYCAFCQAVQELGLSTTCFAVDTWTGDAHSGYYDPEIYTQLKQHHDSRYGRFSTLVKSDFDAARGRFADGSIDLLHIDGFHTYDAVRNDFDTWLSAMSSQGVVLVHDTQVRERDFGVWKFWREVRQEYDHFELPHGYGLGVLAVGRDLPDQFRWLMEEARRSQTLHRFFDSVGAQFELSQTLKHYHADLVEKYTEVERQRGELAAAAAQAAQWSEQQAEFVRRQAETEQTAEAAIQQAQQRLSAQAAEFQTQLLSEQHRLAQSHAHCQHLELEVAHRDRQLAAQALEVQKSLLHVEQQAQHIAALSREVSALQVRLARTEQYYRQLRFRAAERLNGLLRRVGFVHSLAKGAVQRAARWKQRLQRKRLYRILSGSNTAA